MPDHEPPTPPPPLPPPFEAPKAAASTVVRVAQHMAKAKTVHKRLQVTPDEALDRMLADHDRRAAKKKKTQVTPDEALDLLLAEHDRKKAKAANRAVGRAQFAEIMDEEETQPPGAIVAKKAKIAKPPAMKLSKKTKSAAGASGSQRRKKYVA